MTTCYVIADSFGQQGSTGFEHVLCAKLGWTLTLDAIGSTGFVNGGAGGGNAYLTRTPAAVAANPDVLLIQGGMNDRAVLGATVTAATAAVMASVAGLPRVYVVSLAGSDWGTAGPSSMVATVAAIASAVNAAKRPYIDGTAWMTGTGKLGTPMGNGNADVYVDADGTHPTFPAGSGYLGTRLAYAISAPTTGLIR
jgi:lysophospholipase L1-like esterase